MLSRLLRKWSADLLHPIISLLIQARVTPNQLTLAGLVAAVVAGGLVANGLLFEAGVALLLSGTLDALDGELARGSKSDTPFGAFVDSVADHYGDFAVYLGIAWLLIAAGDQTTVLLTLVAMFGSVMGSHIRSRGGMMGLETKDVGVFTRAERILILVAGLMSDFLPAAVALLAIGNNVSALQRIASLSSIAFKNRHRS